MIAVRLWWRMLRHQESQRLTVALALTAFATTTGVLLIVLGGLHAFLRRDGNDIYPLLAETATVILVVPTITLGAAAARLAIARRDERLAALRLAGATSTQVGAIAVIDAVSQAFVGAVLGVLFYLVALPGVALLHFQGRPFAWSELWVGLPTLTLTVAGVVVLAALSATLSLFTLAISPLGVARRTTPRRLSWLRLVIAVAVLACWSPVFRSLSSPAELTGVLVVFGVCFGVLNLLGPLVLGLVGRIAAARASTPVLLLAARRLLDNPRSAWRTVAGVTLATFVSGVLSVAPAMSGSGSGDQEPALLGVDIMTGSVLTLVIAGLLAAVSSGVTSASRLLDQREQYALLHLAGTEVGLLRRARLIETALPLLASVGIAAAVSLLMVAPVGLALIGDDPRGLALFVGGVVSAIALVLAAVGLSQPLVARVAAGRTQARDEAVLVRGRV